MLLTVRYQKTCISLSVFVLLVLSLTFLTEIPTKLKAIYAARHSIPDIQIPIPPKGKTYKPVPESHGQISDNFPLIVSAATNKSLPPVPIWNTPPTKHEFGDTPIFIGFTRNWLLLQQTVVSYLTAGWPASDIYVIENTGTLNSNRDNKLTLQNPNYLDYYRLTRVLGVNIVSTPTLLSFAQLQNFFIHYANNKGWDYYFWSHMDVVALSQETYTDPETHDYKSLYARVVEVYRKSIDSSFNKKWAARWFAYDRLTLVNRAAYEEVGGWDTMIGYYLTDCDMHERLFMAGYELINADAGMIYDIGTSLEDLQILYRRKPAKGSEKWGEQDEIGSQNFHDLVKKLDEMQALKNNHKGGRNFWQGTQEGGFGEPFFRDPTGFEKGLQMMIDDGKKIYAEKWGHRDCDLRKAGLKAEDAWKVKHDWMI